jgi:hypothetical protein
VIRLPLPVQLLCIFNPGWLHDFRRLDHNTLVIIMKVAPLIEEHEYF